ncbi:DUF5684 domain-containing protein [Oceanivirga miroungae]|uniref:Signal peptidase I n=1 Tax=Oceanivirga miroungae TaxID=1130046 RepID=A0A6I8M965_9FUSO|nr:DUF5684 domain-containing protein [Oceanivirga miroungae]VWL84828.1 hypothetical protein OMES3154_00082 [Oceanivirga miroungae]
MLVFFLLILLVYVVSMWKIFTKAGYAGWLSIIPFVNLYLDFKIVYGKGWYFLFMFIPIMNIVVGIKMAFDRAKIFGKGIGFGFGVLFLPYIFIPILAFSDAEYKGTTTLF